MESHDYYARISGKDYPIAYGFQITDEMGETLDSGSITIPHVFSVIPLKPYDDVIIHDYEPNATPEEGGLPNRPYGKIFTPETGHFYRHMLVHSYTRERVSIDDVYPEERTDENGKKYSAHVFNYRIQLKSETSGLDSVQLPNRTISQPMSLAESEGSGSLSANFRFGGESKKYTLPYGQSNSSSGKSFRLMEKVTEQKGEVITYHDYTVLHAWIGDDNSFTADYSSFLTMASKTSFGSAVILPDWSVSAISTATENYDDGGIFGTKRYDNWVGQAIHHPVKHWIVRKLDSARTVTGWESKAIIVAKIRDYLFNGKDYDDIVNSTLTVNGETSVRDITSSEPMNSISVTFPKANASYVIYLYVEPELVGFANGYASPSDAKVNIYGTTDNSDGTTKPTESDEFLCSWGSESAPFSVTNSYVTTGGAASVYEKIRQNVELYSPYVKATSDGTRWTYVRKYVVGESLKALFSSVAAPENQWNCPNLRDLLTKLMYTKDCIPVVHDGVIECMNLSKRAVIPFSEDKGLFGVGSYAMDGNSYCDRLIRTYTDGLSKDNVTQCVERIGFKNSSSSTLTLESLRLELAHPIYKITKVLMCYYDNASVVKSGVSTTYRAVVKHDITPLVVMNSQRNLLSEDWASLGNEKPSSISELAKYKYATVGYDVGSRYITGWGTKYTYPSGFFWSGSKTVIENIYTFAVGLSKYGSNSFTLQSKLSALGTSYGIASEFVSGASSTRKAIYDTGISESADVDKGESSSITMSGTLSTITVPLSDTAPFGGLFSNFTQRLKSLFFIIEYEGYVSAAVVASKDFHDGNVTSRDNASSSLSFVESDGANQKEKVNRLGNAVVTQPVRYASRDDVQSLSQVWDTEAAEGYAKEHEDEVLYQRRMVFERDYVQVAYSFCRNYVLRNYFTSVFAKRRPFALASYEESVERQENRTMQILFSADKQYYQTPSSSKCVNYADSTLLPTLLTFFKATEYDDDGNKVIAQGVDSAYYMAMPSESRRFSGQCGLYASEVQKFTSGNSLCFTISMIDNVSAGVFVSDWNPTVGEYVGNLFRAKYSLLSAWKSGNGWRLSESELHATNMITGSKQDWLMLPIDPDTGDVYSMRFGIGFKRNDFYGIDSPTTLSAVDLASYQMLPLLDAVVIDPDGESLTYFGLNAGANIIIGTGGYPRLTFCQSADYTSYAEAACDVDFSNKDNYYPAAKVMMELDVSKYDSGTYRFYPANSATALGTKRQEIRELMSAKFVAKEADGLEEKDTCVFKDGKERISVTMQAEPVSEDDRILFSDMMMKLSDAMGGYEKNYDEISVGKGIKAIVGMTVRKFEYHYRSEIRGIVVDNHYFSTACFPSVAICVPSGVTPSGIKASKRFSWGGNSSYSIEIGTLNGLDSDGNLLVACVISCSASSSSISETIAFKKYADSDTYIYGRTGLSKLNRRYVFFDSLVESGYDVYYMVEDAFFAYKLNDTIYSMKFDDEAYDGETDSGFVGSPSSRSISGYLISFGDGSFTDPPLLENDKLNFRTESMGYTTTAKESATFTNTWDPVTYTDTIRGVTNLADYAGYSKSRNMYWALGPLMESRETAYEVRSSMDDGDLDVIDGIGRIRTKGRASSQHTVTLTGNKGSSKLVGYVSLGSILEEMLPEGLYEGRKITAMITKYSVTGGTALASVVGGVINTQNQLQVIGYLTSGLTLAAKSTSTVAVTLFISAYGRKTPPVSLYTTSQWNGLWRLKVSLESPLAGTRSIRLYYRQGSEYRFVFGANLGAYADKGNSSDVIYPLTEGGYYDIYVSVMDSRSKTVFDSATGDPSYEMYDWGGTAQSYSALANWCVKKSQ